MVRKRTEGITYVDETVKVDEVSKIDSTQFSSPPKNYHGENNQDDQPCSMHAASSIVANYVEYLRMRRIKSSPKINNYDSSYTKISDNEIISLYKEAKKKDDDSIENGSDYPSLLSLAQAYGDKYFPGQKILWFKTQKILKLVLHKFGACVVEFNYPYENPGNSPVELFPKLSNTNSFSLTSSSDKLGALSDFSKVFVAYGYDSNGLVVMNSLSQLWGSLGFCKIPFSLFDKQMYDKNDDQQLLEDGTKFFIRGFVYDGGLNHV